MPLLLKSQKASLYSLLQEAKGINPAEFEFVSTPANSPFYSEGGDEIRLRGTDYHFTIYPNESERFNAGQFWVEFSPGGEQIHESGECQTWNIVCAAFARYLTYLLRETTTIDPWESAQKFSSDVHALPHATMPNAPITGAEKEEIQNTLNNIQATLLEHVGTSTKKQQYIEEQFSLLRDSITKFGRKDYLMLLYTTVIGMATTIGVPPDVGSQIVGILNELLKHIPKLLA